MARSKSKGSEPVAPTEIEQGRFFLPGDARWGGFINVRLDDEQRAAFDERYASEPNFGAQQLDDMLGEGMKVSMSYDRANQAYIVSLAGKLVSNSNERYAVTSRAGTIHLAIAVASFKHGIVDGDYGNLKANGRAPAWD